MLISASVSLEEDGEVAATDVVRSVLDELAGERPDLAFVFVSRQHLEEADAILSAISSTLGAKTLIGCTADSVVCGADELLEKSAVTVWAAVLPDVNVRPMQLDWPGDGSKIGKEILTGKVPVDAKTLIVFGDPFTFPCDAFVQTMAEERPELCVVGGMASAARARGENRLFLGARSYEAGAVAVALSGAVEISPVVSQGCRPFGKPFVVTKCEENVIQQLGGQSPLEKFTEQVSQLSETERDALYQGLQIGRAVNSAKASDGEGDFLIRGVLGFVKENGSMVIGDEPQRGETIQFHLRDPDSATEEFDRLLEAAHERIDDRAAGALLFTCNGRGTRMFEEEHHDTGALRRRFGPLPVAGFFAAGEIGPIGSQSFLHGFTAVNVIFTKPN